MSKPAGDEKSEEVKPKKAKKASDKAGSSTPILERPWYAFYGFLGPSIGPLLPRFKGLQARLMKAGLPVDFRAYVSFMIVGTIMAFAFTFGVIWYLTLFILVVQHLTLLGVPFTEFALSALAAGLAAGLAFALIYSYPSLMISSRKNKLEQSLLGAVNYMSILSAAGMSPERIFRSLAERPEIPGIYEDARLIVRDIDLFGKDFVSAIQSTRDRSPSKRYSEVLDGFVSIVYTGGDLKKYLSDMSRDLMSVQVDLVRTTINRLSMLAEAAVAIIAVFPLLFLVIFTTASILPGGIMGEPLFVYVVTYFMLPVISILFLIVLSSGATKT